MPQVSKAVDRVLTRADLQAIRNELGIVHSVPVDCWEVVVRPASGTYAIQAESTATYPWVACQWWDDTINIVNCQFTGQFTKSVPSGLVANCHHGLKTIRLWSCVGSADPTPTTGAKLINVLNTTTTISVIAGASSAGETFTAVQYSSQKLVYCDVSNLIGLSTLSCTSPVLRSLQLPPDLSALKTVNFWGVPIDLVGFFDNLPTLDKVVLNTMNAVDEVLDFANSPAMNWVQITSSNCRSVICRDKANLVTFFVTGGLLEEFDVSGVTTITQFGVDGTKLPRLELKNHLSLTYFTAAGIPTLTEVDLTGTILPNGAILRDNALTTDAIYQMVDGLANNGGAVRNISISGNPAWVSGSLVDGVLNSAATTNALAASKGYALVA